MKQLVALIMIAFLVPTAAMAKNAPCKEDKAKFCKDVKASGGKVSDCLKQHIGEVTAACKESLEKPKEAKPAKEPKAKKTESTTPSEAAKPAEPAPADATPPSAPASPGQSETKP